mmetsp:Transcript_36813/g.66735  ORF Transcript_36813/g.66735 Transcript_36813/m.66735 type:complete len:90 (+) Transcript_36813:144-413(+)
MADGAPSSPAGIPSTQSQRSILSGMSERGERADAHGNKIEKGSKQHKATFKDEVEESPLHEVREVQSYKGAYTQNMGEGEKQGCGCSLM